MKTNLIITIPISYNETMIDYDDKQSIVQRKFDNLKPILSELFGCASPTINAGIQFLPKQDEKTSEICKQMSGKLFKLKDIEKARNSFDIETRRCFIEPTIKAESCACDGAVDDGCEICTPSKRIKLVEENKDNILPPTPNDLKPCPFCGEDDLKIFENKVKDNNNKPTSESYWFVSCWGECFFAGPSSTESTEDAIVKWNKRE